MEENTITLRQALDMFDENLIEIMDAVASNLRDDIAAYEKESQILPRETPLMRTLTDSVIRIGAEQRFSDRARTARIIAMRLEDKQVRHPQRGRITDGMVARAREHPIEQMYVGKLSKKGGDMWGVCPFHSEKTASFHISPKKNVWYCHGCSQGGDAIAFYMKANGMEPKDFPKAVRAMQ